MAGASSHGVGLAWRAMRGAKVAALILAMIVPPIAAIAHAYAAYVLASVHWGWHAVAAAIAVIVIALMGIPLVLALAAFFAAIWVWDWSWPWALLFALPGLITWPIIIALIAWGGDDTTSDRTDNPEDDPHDDPHDDPDGEPWADDPFEETRGTSGPRVGTGALARVGLPLALAAIGFFVGSAIWEWASPWAIALSLVGLFVGRVTMPLVRWFTNTDNLGDGDDDTTGNPVRRGDPGRGPRGSAGALATVGTAVANRTPRLEFELRDDDEDPGLPRVSAT